MEGALQGDGVVELLAVDPPSVWVQEEAEERLRQPLRRAGVR